MAFFDDLQQDFKRQPLLTRLIIINVVVFLLVNTLDLFLGGALSAATGMGFNDYLAIRPNLWYTLTHPWTPITHMFTHADFRHILYNMVGIFFVGRLFLTFFNSRRLLSTYLLGGFAGAIAFVIVYNALPGLSDMTPAVGASAAFMAILLAAAAYQPKMRVNLFGIVPVQLALIAGILVALDYVSLNGSSNFGGHIAHLGGAAYGFAMGYQMRKAGRFGLADRFESFLDRLFNWSFFRRGTKMRVVRNEADSRRVSDEDWNANKKAREERMNAILDKVSRRGYDSLTRSEKEFLNKYSQGS